MRYSGIQPQYFPRLHYFARILNTDIFVIRDDAQFVRRHRYPDGRIDKSYQAHTPIKYALGVFFLTVPTVHKGLFPLIKTGVSYDQNWGRRHLKTIQMAYGRAPYFEGVYPEVEHILTMRYEDLAELNSITILWGILRLLGQHPVSREHLSIAFVEERLRKQNIFRLKTIKRASQSKALAARGNLSPNEKIIALLREVGANEDYCGETAVLAYMDKDLFHKHNIKITVQNWKGREHPQQFTKQQGFIPNLSIIDLLMNVSSSDARSIIRG